MAEPIPRGARVLVKVLDDREQPSGLVMPPGVESGSPSRGTVTHVGPGYRLPDGEYAPLDLTPGDEVLFYRSKGVDVRIDDEDLLLLHDEAVLITTEPAPVHERARHDTDG